MSKKGLGFLLFPFLILLILTLFFRLTNADISLASLFYSQDQGWFLEKTWVVTFLNLCGTIPEFVVAAASAVILGYGFFSQKFCKYRKIAMFVFLVFLIGEVLIVNVVLKHHWGRPRPNQTEIFGQKQAFLPVLVRGDCEECRSFPSGHAAAGFFLVIPFFVYRHEAPRIGMTFLIFGLAYGFLMGLSRMARGAHFASDVIWAGAIIYYTGMALYYLLGMHINIWWEKGRVYTRNLLGEPGKET